MTCPYSPGAKHRASLPVVQRDAHEGPNSKQAAREDGLRATREEEPIACHRT
jgi:hypothetical protein